jgi:hypothetical protein
VYSSSCEGKQKKKNPNTTHESRCILCQLLLQIDIAAEKTKDNQMRLKTSLIWFWTLGCANAYLLVEHPVVVALVSGPASLILEEEEGRELVNCEYTDWSTGSWVWNWLSPKLVLVFERSWVALLLLLLVLLVVSPKRYAD